MKTAYDPDYMLTYEIWICPTCKAEFYGGGRALHNHDCTDTGYANCIRVIGPHHHFSRGEERLEPSDCIPIAEVRV